MYTSMCTGSLKTSSIRTSTWLQQADFIDSNVKKVGIE